MTINAIFMTVSVLAICATVVLITLVKAKDNADRRQWANERAEKIGQNLEKMVSEICETKRVEMTAKAEKNKEEL